ncbi:MAG: preprotein translocase subunit YajC [Clostridia bacterium]|nr:preprotein translocase subunit YajC [Clostridia bacterium]
MLNLICAANQVTTYVIYGVLILILVVMLILPYFTQRKRNQEYTKMIQALKVGDLVQTQDGVIGKVIKLSDKGEIKTVILETGAKNEKSYIEFNIGAVAYVLNASKPAQPKEEKVEEPVEEKKEEPAKEEKVEEKPAAKKRGRKPAAK